jgi:DNA-binding IclR family transcriptional regulator
MAAELPSVPAARPPVGLSIVGEPTVAPRRRIPVPVILPSHVPVPVGAPAALHPAPVERPDADVLDGSAVRSVDRAAALLLALGDFPTEAGVTELARKLGLHKSTASRLLATLQRRGLVEQDEESGKYRLGLVVIRLAERAEKTLDLGTLARSELERLARSTRETVGLTVLDGERCLTVAQVDGPNMVACPDWTGRTTPLHCVASGKVLLATMAERDVMRLAKKGLQACTERTITTLEQLLEELARVRRRGFATAFSEWELGQNGIAAPVHDARGRVVASVVIWGPAYRITPARIVELAAEARAAASAISTRLGGAAAWPAVTTA